MGFYELLNEFLSGKGEITIRVRGEPTGFKIELSLGHPLGETDSEHKRKEVEERMPQPESPETHKCLPEMEKDGEDKGRGERNGIEANGHRKASGFSGGSGLWGFEKLGPITSIKKKTSFGRGRQHNRQRTIKTNRGARHSEERARGDPGLHPKGARGDSLPTIPGLGIEKRGKMQRCRHQKNNQKNLNL